MHARMPRNFVLEERIERYADAIELEPAAYRGRWAAACAAAGSAPFARASLDLGCGKGVYLVEAARRHPDTLFIGVDSEPVCIVYAAQAILEAGLRNAVAIPARADGLARIFAPGELGELTISFPTPFPKKKQAAERVTSVDRLLEYRDLLAPGAALTLRTDSQPLFDFTMGQLAGAGYRTRWTSRDVRADHPEIPGSEYEHKLADEGATVLGACAEVGPEPTPEQVEAARAMPQSLFAYVPDDLYEGAYVPHGMGYAIQTFRNRRANAERRAGRAERAQGRSGKGRA